jgi:hypothetical protein
VEMHERAQAASAVKLDSPFLVGPVNAALI